MSESYRKMLEMAEGKRSFSLLPGTGGDEISPLREEKSTSGPTCGEVPHDTNLVSRIDSLEILAKSLQKQIEELIELVNEVIGMI